MSIDTLIAACHVRSCAPPPVGAGGSSSSGGGSTAAMRNPLGASRAAAGASGVEHLIKQSAGHPAQRFIQKAHEAFRDSRRTGIGQNDSQSHDHAEGMKALRQAHAMARASSPRGTLHSAIKTALIKKKAESMNQHSMAASAFTKEEFMAAAEEFYNHNHGAGGKFSSGPGGGGGGGPVLSIKHRLSAKRIQQGSRRADYLNKTAGKPASHKVKSGNYTTNHVSKFNKKSTEPSSTTAKPKMSGIAANIAKHNTQNPKKSGSYITKENAARIAKAESRRDKLNPNTPPRGRNPLTGALQDKAPRSKAPKAVEAKAAKSGTPAWRKVLHEAGVTAIEAAERRGKAKARKA